MDEQHSLNNNSNANNNKNSFEKSQFDRIIVHRSLCKKQTASNTHTHTTLCGLNKLIAVIATAAAAIVVIAIYSLMHPMLE